MIRDRGTEVNKEYQRNADKIDRQFQPELREDEPGWVRSKLSEFGKVKGLAFGYYSEMPQDVSELIELLVKAKRGSVMRSLGLHSPEEATSWTRKGIMRSLGWGISLGWSTLKIKVFHEAVEYGGQTGRATDHSQIQELLDAGNELGYSISYRGE